MNHMTPERSETARMAPHDIEGLAGRALKLALFVNLLIPAMLVIAVYVLRLLDVMPRTTSFLPDKLQLLYFVLVFVALSELVAALVLKKAMFGPDKVRPTLGSTEEFGKLVIGGTVTLAALGASPVLYGIVLYILGEDISKVALFTLVTLVHFRLFRPTAEFLHHIVSRAAQRDSS